MGDVIAQESQTELIILCRAKWLLITEKNGCIFRVKVKATLLIPRTRIFGIISAPSTLNSISNQLFAKSN